LTFSNQQDDYQSDFEEVASTDEEDLEHAFLETKITTVTSERDQITEELNKSIDSQNLPRELPQSSQNDIILQHQTLENQIDEKFRRNEDEEAEDSGSEYSDELSTNIDNHKPSKSETAYPGFFGHTNSSDQGTGDSGHHLLSSSNKEQINLSKFYLKFGFSRQFLVIHHHELKLSRPKST